MDGLLKRYDRWVDKAMDKPVTLTVGNVGWFIVLGVLFGWFK